MRQAPCSSHLLALPHIGVVPRKFDAQAAPHAPPLAPASRRQGSEAGRSVSFWWRATAVGQHASSSPETAPKQHRRSKRAGPAPSTQLAQHPAGPAPNWPSTQLTRRARESRPRRPSYPCSTRSRSLGEERGGREGGQDGGGTTGRRSAVGSWQLAVGRAEEERLAAGWRWGGQAASAWSGCRVGSVACGQELRGSGTGGVWRSRRGVDKSAGTGSERLARCRVG